MDYQIGDAPGMDEENVDASLRDIIMELRRGETVVFDVDEDEPDNSDAIFDTLLMKGFSVRRAFLNGKNTIIVSK